MDPSLTNTLSNYSAILSVLGRNEEALPIASQVLDIERTLRGPNHPQVAFALEQRGSMYRKLKRGEDARRDFERAIDIYNQVHGPHHASSGNAWSGLANLALEGGDEAQAILLLETALRCYAELDEFRSQRGQAQFELARLLWKDRSRRGASRDLAKLARAEFVEVGARGEQYLSELDDWERTHR